MNYHNRFSPDRLIAILSLALFAILPCISEEEMQQENKSTPAPGQLTITGDQKEFSNDKKICTVTGHAVMKIVGQNSSLEADKVIFDKTKNIVDAIGNVKIYRNDDLSTGSRFKFNIENDGYLIINPKIATRDLEGNVIKQEPIPPSKNFSVYQQFGKHSPDGGADQFLHGSGGTLRGDF